MRAIALFGIVLWVGATVLAQGSGACNPATGLAVPVPACTPANPCTQPDPSLGVSILTVPTQIPVCHPTEGSRPFFDDGSPQHSMDAQGVDRYACVFRPAGASRLSPRPAIVFFHGGLSSATTVYNAMSLRSKALSFDLTEDPLRAGFFLLSVQGRNLLFPTDASPQGRCTISSIGISGLLLRTRTSPTPTG